MGCMPARMLLLNSTQRADRLPIRAWGANPSVVFASNPKASRTADERPLPGAGLAIMLLMDPPTQQHWLHELPARRRVEPAATSQGSPLSAGVVAAEPLATSFYHQSSCTGLGGHN